jgi:DNA-binding Lrp family transcriptional regulator
MDRIDFAIVEALQTNGRLSNKELAGKVGLAPSSCLQRTRALMKKGVINGFHADVSLDALGVGLQAFIAVRLTMHRRDPFKGLCEHLVTLPEVRAVFHVSGPNDLLVHVAVRDVAALRDFVVERLSTRAEVDRYETSIIYSSQGRALTPPRAPRAAAGAPGGTSGRSARSPEAIARG